MAKYENSKFRNILLRSFDIKNYKRRISKEKRTGYKVSGTVSNVSKRCARKLTSHKINIKTANKRYFPFTKSDLSHCSIVKRDPEKKTS